MRAKLWRVRVSMAQEGWVEVLALSGAEAEILAGAHPGVIQVFSKSAVPGDQPAHKPIVAGVEEE
jgi:hypothetical protein